MTKTLFSLALLAVVSAGQGRPEKPDVDTSINLPDIATPELPKIPADIIAFPPWWKPRRAYCRMHYDPTNPTTNPYGYFKLYQANPFADVKISGWMKQMPPPASEHGFHINYKPYYWSDENDCHDSTLPRWDEQPAPYPTGPAGQMNDPISQVGNLAMIADDAAGNASYYAQAWKPTMYSFGWFNKSIMKRAMVIYENEDDFGTQPSKASYYFGSNLEAIACCNITPFKIWIDYEVEYKKYGYTYEDWDQERQNRSQSDEEWLTLEQYREIFGKEYDPADWDEDAFEP